MPNRGEQGTGRHPHKSTAEPYPHTQGAEKGHKASGRGSESSGESGDLKSREYRDKEGNIHHHTRTYERDHPGKSR